MTEPIVLHETPTGRTVLYPLDDPDFLAVCEERAERFGIRYTPGQLKTLLKAVGRA
jgi:hypothetical protein